MKKIVLLITVLLLWVGQGWALTYSGSLSSAPNGGLYATQSWAGLDDDSIANSTFSWEIESAIVDGGTESDFYKWTYNYTWETNSDAKDLSHIIVQVSDNFTLENVFSTTPDFENDDLKVYVPNDPSNPDFPTTITGVKFEVVGDHTLFNFTIVTDRAPMWGNFYAKSGNGGNNSSPTYAYNTGFVDGLTAPLFDPLLGISMAPPDFNDVLSESGPVFTGADDLSYGWALVPDTRVIYDGGGGGGGGIPAVPEPGTIILVGAGLVGLALLRRKQGR